MNSMIISLVAEILWLITLVLGRKVERATPGDEEFKAYLRFGASFILMIGASTWYSTDPSFFALGDLSLIGGVGVFSFWALLIGLAFGLVVHKSRRFADRERLPT